jgi:acyl-CoA synthetase (AMP-forming)/AMP-acid ligase II
VGSSGPRLLSERVAREGGAAIVRSSGESVSYAELHAAIERAATTLAEGGARPRTLVAIAASDPAGYLVASLATWRVGAAAVPCDPRAGPHAVERVIARARPAVVVRDASVHGDLLLSPANAPRELDERVALLLFTSGSSAAPKGVLLSAAGIDTNLRAITAYLPVTASSRVAVVVPLSYSYGLVGQAMTTLWVGGTLLLLNDLPFATTQIDRMCALAATGLSSVPASLRLLARAAVDKGAHPELAFCSSAGAPLDPSTVTLMRAAFPHARLFNQYGLTEASPRVAWIDDRDPAFARGASGRAVEGVEIRVVSETGASQPGGQEGEIEVRGVSVMLGYLDDPEATARATSRDGWLRTNDVGRIEDGCLYVRGRSDGVVKCAGERVSLDEVADVLRRAPGVRDACVIATPDEAMGVELHAFVECDDAHFATLRAYARAELAPAKRPRHLARLDALPRTSNGKIALAELRARIEPS